MTDTEKNNLLRCNSEINFATTLQNALRRPRGSFVSLSDMAVKAKSQEMNNDDVGVNTCYNSSDSINHIENQNNLFSASNMMGISDEDDDEDVFKEMDELDISFPAMPEKENLKKVFFKFIGHLGIFSLLVSIL